MPPDAPASPIYYLKMPRDARNSDLAQRLDGLRLLRNWRGGLTLLHATFMRHSMLELQEAAERTLGIALYRARTRPDFGRALDSAIPIKMVVADYQMHSGDRAYPYIIAIGAGGSLFLRCDDQRAWPQMLERARTSLRRSIDGGF